MKPITLKKNSWHYWLASSEGHIHQTSICAYFWLVVWGAINKLFALIGLLGMTVIGTGFIVLTAGGAGMALWSLATWSNQFVGEPFIGGAIMDGVGLLLFLYIWLPLHIFRKTGQRVVGQPGFVKLAYRSFKDKVCVKINLE